MSKFLLSISVPTFNRSVQLLELVHSLLSIKSDVIEVVVTDNQSTDDTLERLKEIKDSRLKICRNEKAVPAFYNMILGLYNASGKYVMHCNDRDIIFTRRIQKILHILENNEFSFVKTTRGYKEPSYRVEIYEKGYDSIIHMPHTCHPTGMIFNTTIMHKYLSKENYFQYVDATFTYSFLMRDVLMYERSAIYDCGLWNERHSRIKLQIKSGSVYKGGLYFEPDRICVFMKTVIEHLFHNPNFLFSEKEKEELLFNVIDYFKKQLMLKKICYADKRECAHYGIKRKYFGYFRMRKIYEKYMIECDSVIRNYLEGSGVSERWNKVKQEYRRKLARDCLITDYGIIVKGLKRLTDKDYPY